MLDFDLNPLVVSQKQRFEELEVLLADTGIFSDSKKVTEILREHARIKNLLTASKKLEEKKKQLIENQVIINGSDEEFAQLAREENEEITRTILQIEEGILFVLLPPQVDDARDAIIEIRAGTGGSEAAIFAGDLYRMYIRYAENNRLQYELLDANSSDAGGYKEVIFRISGEQIFRQLRYESGVHRVQRVPTTEAQGRIHTSTATVAVLPEAEEVDIDIRPQDLRIEVCRSGGPGGQGVNTTDSAVQILHIPTGKIVRCQDGRSQQKNKEKALTILRSRLLEEKRLEEAMKYSQNRQSQIGTGGREEKIRTYNFPQNRVTDHRIGLTLYSLDRFIDGEIIELIHAIEREDTKKRLSAIIAR